MDYSQLSDFEINKLVAKATDTQIEETYQFVNGGEDIADHMSGIVMMRKITSNRKHWKLYDPCNNAADAWPIILKNGINVFTDMIPHGLLGQARASVISHEPPKSECIIAKDANPLRAAMIVFLMIQDVKHA